MIGKRKEQRELFDVGNVFALELDARTFFGQLAAAASRLFKDTDFEVLYSATLGRPSVPPSQLALLALLQRYTMCSDEEARDRSGYDLRWAAVLGRGAGEPLCAKSTFQEFKAQLIIHGLDDVIFRKGIAEAKRAGLLKKGTPLRIALDTKPILGRGAVEDTFNLLGHGIVRLVGALAKDAGTKAADWAALHGLSRYFGSSLKASADIDWSDTKARRRFLSEVVTDARRLLHLAEVAMADEELPKIREAAGLLERLLLQDVKETPSGGGGVDAELKQGTTPNRIPSVTDAEQRHGHKSHSNRFTGHKLSQATAIGSGIIVDVDVLPGNAGDAEGALEQVERVKGATEEEVAQTTGDCAYGGGKTREAFAQAGRDFAAKVPQENPNKGLYVKSQFALDLEQNTVTCPGGQTTDVFREERDCGKVFSFGERCSQCPLRAQCTTSRDGRTIRVHPQEGLLRAAREYQETPDGRARLRERVAVEHSLARMSHLGAGQARYVGRAKTRFQMKVTATVANLRRTWNWEQAQSGGGNPGGSPKRSSKGGVERAIAACLDAGRGLLGALRRHSLHLGQIVLRVCATHTTTGAPRRGPICHQEAPFRPAF